MSFSPQLNPQPFGPVNVVTAGTPVQLSSKLVSLGITASGEDIPFNKISILARETNTGNIYVGIKGMVKSTRQGVIVVINPSGNFPSWQITHNVGMNIYHLQDFWVDSDVNGEGVYGAFDQN